MPALTAGQLTSLRTTPHKSKLYMVVQQPMYRSGSNWAGYLWSCQVNGNPAGTIGDLVAAITVDNGDAGGTDLLDGMTIFIGTNKGDHDKGVFVVRTDQLGVDNATITLEIGSTSEIVGIVENNDWIVVLDEFRLWTRYPRITEAAGDLTWYKDYDLLYSALGANAILRREASLPAVPIMGPPAVKFIDVGSTEDISFDWSDSYATYPGAAINAWSSYGNRGSVSGLWSSFIEDPLDQTYDGVDAANNDISGMAGYRVWMELGTDAQDPVARFRRGVRYVFTLRRPGERADNDPSSAEPIVDFELTSLSGSFDEGSWSASVTISSDEASEYLIWDGALVVIFADDWYGETKESVGPIDDRENILFVGHIADGTIRQDSETGDTSFDLLSVAGQAQNRDMYPVVIENLDSAGEWYECPDLTVDRAAWFYLVWHSTLSLISDFYWAGDAHEIRAMDFLAGSIYSTMDSFYRDRIFAHFLSDRFGRNKAEVDLQLEIEGSGTTILTLTDADTIDDVQFRELNESPTSIVELGGISYDAGLIVPYLSKAPGTVNRPEGSQFQNTSMAITDQAELNLLAGRMLAKMVNLRPEAIFPFAGNWRVFDIWPQEYIEINTATDRYTFSSDNFIPRRIEIAYEDESVFVAVTAEGETGGISGQTIVIPDDLPPIPKPPIPVYPPVNPPGPGDDGAIDTGRRIISTDVGVFVTDNIGDSPPLWYAVNSGFSTADDLRVMDIKRDPFHWWTSGGTERTLWATCGSGVWKHEDFPYGTWVQQVTHANMVTAGMTNQGPRFALYFGRMDLSIEVENLYAVTVWNDYFGTSEGWGFVINGAVIANGRQFYGTNSGGGWGDIKFAPHGAGNIIYAAANRAPAHGADSEAYLQKTINRGVAWDVPAEDILNVNYKGSYCAISIPYIDALNPDSFILWGRGGAGAGMKGRYRISENASTTWDTINDSEIGASAIGTGGHPDYIFFLGTETDVTTSKYSIDRGVTYAFAPPIATVGFTHAAFVRWNAGSLQTVLMGFHTNAPVVINMYIWAPGISAWVDKTGNLQDFGAAEVYQVDRDSMGTA